MCKSANFLINKARGGGGRYFEQYIFEQNCERQPQWTPSKDKTFIEQLEEWLAFSGTSVDVQ